MLVLALSADAGTIRHGALGAVAGTATVGLAALLGGAALVAAPHLALLWGAAVVLSGFAVVLFRSTLKSYRRSRASAAGTGSPVPTRPALRFAGGFTVGAVETTEVVVVLLALAAAGEARSALLGAVAGGVVLVVAAAIVHERLRWVKTTWLKLGATAMVGSFAVFWAGSAAGLPWPGADLSLIPLFLASLGVVRGAVGLALRRDRRRSGAPGAA